MSELTETDELYEGDPVIIVHGTNPDRDHVVYELRRRGFLVASHIVVKDVLTFAVKMSKKLMVKLAIECDIEIKSASKKFKLGEKQLLANRAVHLVLKTKSVGAKAAWIAHDGLLINMISASKGQSQLELLNSYYGSKIALYFGWLDFYTLCLRAPALAGILLFAHQYYMDAFDSSWVPLFCVCICVWGTYFLEFWKRRCSELSYAWKVFGVEDEDEDREMATSASKETSGDMLRRVMSIAATLCVMYVLVRLMLFYHAASARAEEYYGEQSYLKYYPTAVYSLIPVVATAVFDPLIHMLCEFENHSTTASRETALIAKKFALQFVNRYCALLYTAFWLKDVEALQALLISLLTTGALVNNAVELGVPYATAMYNRYTAARLHAAENTTNNSPTGNSSNDTPTKVNTNTSNAGMKANASGKFSANSDDDEDGDRMWRDLLLAETARTEYDVNEDYLEMVLQYGYLSMFAVVLPIAPLLAFVNNYFEGRVDMTKLSECRRCHIEPRSSIGAWQTCLEVISFGSVLTNCYLLAMVSTKLAAVLPGSFSEHLDSENERFIAMLLIEHVLVAVKVLMMALIDDVPRWVREAVAKESIEQRARAQQSRVHEHVQFAAAKKAQQKMTEKGDSVNIDSTLAAAQFAHLRNQAPQHTTRNAAIARLTQETNTQFGFDPINMAALIALPLALQYWGITPYLYVPVAVLFFSYMQAKKDRADRKVAIGIVSDPTLVKFVVEELPSWVHDSDVQRVEWLNGILQRLWGKVSLATEDLVIASVQPLLDANTPIYLSCLSLTRFHLGSISPKLVGVRVYDTEESSVRLDVELRWAGDPVISLKVGTRPIPITVEVAELRISAVVRVELVDLKASFPCFRALSVTCMKKPTVDFSLKIASLDLMNIGASDFNVSKLVRNLLHGIIVDAVLFPKKIVIPMEPPKDTDAAAPTSADDASQLTPVGILTLTFEKATNLRQANIFGSDPYVEIRPQPFGEVQRTSTKMNTLNPEWHESFDFMIYDKATQRVDLAVVDYDMAQRDKLLGKCSIELGKMPCNVRHAREMRLIDGDKGVLHVSCLYIPIGSTQDKVHQVAEEEHQDILFDIAKLGVGEGGGDGGAGGVILNDDELRLEETDEDEYDGYDDNATANSFTGSNASDLTANSPAHRRLRVRSLPNPRLSARPDMTRQLGSRVLSTNPHTSVGVLSVSQLRLTGIKAPTWLGMNSSSFRPYISLTVSNTVKSTKPHRGTSVPLYNESFSFVVKDPAHDVLTVRVLDRNKWTAHRLIGSVDIPVSDVVGSNKGVLEQAYMLESEEQECHVTLRLTWLSSR